MDELLGIGRNLLVLETDLAAEGGLAVLVDARQLAGRRALGHRRRDVDVAVHPSTVTRTHAGRGAAAGRPDESGARGIACMPMPCVMLHCAVVCCWSRRWVHLSFRAVGVARPRARAVDGSIANDGPCRGGVAGDLATPVTQVRCSYDSRRPAHQLAEGVALTYAVCNLRSLAVAVWVCARCRISCLPV